MASTTVKRFSKQRNCIMRVLSGTTSHPTANWIYDKVREEIPNISLGTVYRNLSTLSNDGDILRLTVGDGTEHYDACIKPHYHLWCKNCGGVYDIKVSYLDDLDLKAEKHSDVEIDCHRVMFYGTCSQCKNE